jgi:hypothetical protein
MLPKKLLFFKSLGRLIPLSLLAFFSGGAPPKKLKHAAQSGAQVQEFLEPIFLKITFSSKYNQPFLRYKKYTKNAERVS